MKIKTWLGFSLALFALSAVAEDFHNGTQFSAPNVVGYSNVGNAQTGDIVFDTSNVGFYGFNGTTWTLFGSTAHAPTVQPCEISPIKIIAQ